MKNLKNLKCIKNIIGIIIGAISLIESFVIFDKWDGEHVFSLAYGGDAYTGIQNAAAQTANNISSLAAIVREGFFAVLLVTGLILICFSAINLIEAFKENQKKNEEGKKELNDNMYQIINEQSADTSTSAEAETNTETPQN